MKKFFLLCSAVLLWTSCHKEPDTSDLDSDFIVETDYDSSADFSSYTTFFIPDSVLVIGGEKEPRYWVNNESNEMIRAFADKLKSRGYVQTENRNEADLGLQISYILDTSYFAHYYDDPYWWWGYPSYWGPGYWGTWWDGWYYPYPVVYHYQIGSLLAEMIDLKAKAPRDAGSRLTVLWSAYMTGLLSGSDQINMQLALRAIDQAFTQTPQIKK